MAITTIDGVIAGAIQPAQFAKALSGAMVAGRPYTNFYAAGIPNAVDALTSGFPRCYDNTVPFTFFVPQTTTTGLTTGSVNFAQG